MVIPAYVWLLVIAIVFVEAKNYTNYEVLSIHLRYPEDHARIINLLESDLWDEETDIWRAGHEVGESVDVMLHRNITSSFVKELGHNALLSSAKIHNVQRLIDNENSSSRDRRSITLTNEDALPIGLDEYNSYDDISLFLDGIAKACASPSFPSKYHCSVESVGKSWEGRELRVVRLGKRQATEEEITMRPVIIVDAGTHAREWIVTAVALNLIRKLVDGASDDMGVRLMLRSADWYINPLVNPDGYQYTRDKDRMWRKTRSVHPAMKRRGKGYRDCVGVDANRNWSYKWGGPGSSGKCTSDTYRGPRPFSEPETRAWSQYIDSAPGQKIAYITLHSYGQYLIYPWGYKAERSRNAKDHITLLKSMAKKMKRVNDVPYKVVLGSKVLGVTSGVSDDWAYVKQSIKYSHTLELRDTGNFGFVLPASQITPTSEEVYAGLKQMVKTLKNNGEL